MATPAVAWAVAAAATAAATAAWLLGATLQLLLAVTVRVGAASVQLVAAAADVGWNVVAPGLPGLAGAAVGAGGAVASWACSAAAWVLHALALVAANAISALSSLTWVLLLWVRDVSPGLFYAVLSVAKLGGAAVVDAAIALELFVWGGICDAAASLRDPAAPNTPVVGEHAARVALGAAAFASAVVLSDAAGAHYVAVRPVFVVPLLLASFVVAFAYDDVRGNDRFVDVAGGLVVLWGVAAAAVHVHETWLSARLREWWARKERERQRHLRALAERRRREEFREAVEQARATERDRSAAAAAAAAATAAQAASSANAGQADIVGDSDECPVCLETYATNRVHLLADIDVRGDGRDSFSSTDKLVLPCRHHLHVSCGRDWLRNSATCPMCRQRVHAAGRFVLRLLAVR